MTKHTLSCLCWVFLLAGIAAAKDYKSEHFIIRSDLDPCCVQFARSNAEAYYKNLQGHYFQKGWQNQLIIYYSKSKADTQKLLAAHGFTPQASDGFYIDTVPAIYIHRLTDDGEAVGCRGLFKQITRHFIQLNFQNAPAWFKEGLLRFLGEQSCIVRGKLIPQGPNPLKQKILKDKIEEGGRTSIRSLYSRATHQQFQNWDIGCHFARAFFYWLYETELLELFLKNTYKGGFRIPVLEVTLSKNYGEKDPIGKANMELLKKFIKKNCYAESFLQDGLKAADQPDKERAFLKALDLKPDYHTARLELAKCYYKSGDYENCRRNLEEILNTPENIECRRSARLMGDTYYNKKDYAKALKYYNKTWEYSDFYEYKYHLAYRIANCHYYLKDQNNASFWYGRFLKWNWQPKSDKASVYYAQKYIELVDAKTAAIQKQKNKKPRTRKRP